VLPSQLLGCSQPFPQSGQFSASATKFIDTGRSQESKKSLKFHLLAR
jgi:hypothetical protein